LGPLLEVSNIVAGYGRSRVLKEFSLKVEAGEAVAVLGANGAGKSTLMKCIAGLLHPWQGQIFFDGEDVTSVDVEDRVTLGVVLAPEGRGIFGSLSIEQNLLVGATSLRRRYESRMVRARIEEGLEKAFGLFEVLRSRRDDLASRLSGGQQQMLAIARALMAEPKLLLLDEPCLGLAPKVANDVYAALQTLRDQGQSLIVVEESARRALAFADRACVVKLGRKLLEDRAAAITGDEQLLEAYFGLSSQPTT